MKKLKIIIPIIIICLIIFIGIVYNKYHKDVSQLKLQKVTYMVPFISDIDWAHYYVAKFKGFYKEEGLDVEIQYSAKGGAGPIEQLVGGNVDFILTTTSAMLMAKSKGLDLVALYPIEPRGVFYIISKKDKGITRPSDLIGKKVGVVSSASDGYSNLLAVLLLSKINTDEVEIVNAGTSLSQAFLGGKFDAAVVHISQLILIEENSSDLNIMKMADYTNISSGHIVVKKELIKKNSELIKKFLRATKKGLEYAVKNPEEAVEIYIRLNKDAESQKKQNQDLWNALIKEYNFQENIPEQESDQDWQNSQDVLYNIGLINKKINTSDLYTNEFIPK